MGNGERVSLAHSCKNICLRIEGSSKGVGKNGYKGMRYCQKCVLYFPEEIVNCYCPCCGLKLRTKAADRKKVKLMEVEN